MAKTAVTAPIVVASSSTDSRVTLPSWMSDRAACRTGSTDMRPPGERSFRAGDCSVDTPVVRHPAVPKAEFSLLQSLPPAARNVMGRDTVGRWIRAGVAVALAVGHVGAQQPTTPPPGPVPTLRSSATAIVV